MQAGTPDKPPKISSAAGAANNGTDAREGRQEGIMIKTTITKEEKAVLEAFRKSKRSAEFLEALNRLSKSQAQECGVYPKERSAKA